MPVPFRVMPKPLRPLAIPLLLTLPALAAPPTVEDDPLPPPPEFEVRVERIVADATLDVATGEVRAKVSLTVRAKGLAQIRFGIGEPLAVESSSASAGVVEHRKLGETLVADVDPPIDGTRTLTFSISGVPRLSGEARIRAGLAVLGPEDGWIPRHPGTWAETDVTVRVPEGWTAVAPGTPDAKRDRGVWRWRSGVPVRSIAIAAGPGLVLSETTIGKLPVRVAAPESGPDAKGLAPRIFPAVAWHSGAFAPYAFDGFNAVFLPGLDRRTRGSGIAAVPASFPLETDADGAELVSGQWFGERLAGDGAWIEAFAAWEPTVYSRDRALPLPSETVRQRRDYFALLSGDVALSRATASAPEAVLRGKGSAAPDMLRLVVGDRAFFDGMRALFRRPVGPPVSLDDLRVAVSPRSNPASAKRAFEDWFGKPGIPEITARVRTLETAEDDWRTDLDLTQERGIYALPVEVVFHGEEGREHRETIEIEEAKTPLVYVLPFKTLRVEVDPLGRIFRWP